MDIYAGLPDLIKDSNRTGRPYIRDHIHHQSERDKLHSLNYQVET